jgi:hypothetical protein
VNEFRDQKATRHPKSLGDSCLISFFHGDLFGSRTVIARALLSLFSHCILTAVQFTMKFSALAALSLLAGPAVAEIYFKEDFNDEVCGD